MMLNGLEKGLSLALRSGFVSQELDAESGLSLDAGACGWTPRQGSERTALGRFRGQLGM